MQLELELVEMTSNGHFCVQLGVVDLSWRFCSPQQPTQLLSVGQFEFELLKNSQLAAQLGSEISRQLNCELRARAMAPRALRSIARHSDKHVDEFLAGAISWVFGVDFLRTFHFICNKTMPNSTESDHM